MIPIPACRVVASPGDGRVRSTVAARTPVSAGDIVGILDTPRGERHLLAPGPGLVGGPLVRNAQQVAAGEAVLWLTRR